ncbi:MAG: helix-turn-helix domain-containing protein [Lachnospiraceae bacterium]|nr:helix-turn-helix domain-containing protein [Lachnospiraceae bacterium]
MLDEKLYTVADVAQVTGMTSRTIRNYLKDGTLTGQKIGVQWRFTEDEIKKLFSRQTPGQSSPTQVVKGFLGEQERQKACFCALLDFPGVTELDGMELYRKLQEERGEGIDSMSYEYHDEGQLLRIAVSGDTGAVMDLLEQMKAGMKSA